MVLKLTDQPVSTLAAELMRVGQSERNIFLRSAEENDTGLSEIRIGEFGYRPTRTGKCGCITRSGRRSLPSGLEGTGQSGAEGASGKPSGAGRNVRTGIDGSALQPLGRIVPGVEVQPRRSSRCSPDAFCSARRGPRRPEAIALVIGTLLVGLLSLRVRHQSLPFSARSCWRVCWAAAGMPFANTAYCSIAPRPRW